MNQELATLYQTTILDHGHHPRNCGKPKKYDQKLEGFNHLCGDKIMIYCNCSRHENIKISFESVSCVICTASASLMTTELEDASRQQAIALIDEVLNGLNNASLCSKELSDQLLGLSGVVKFPSRIQCATLPWETTRKIILDSGSFNNGESGA
ncbi:MAG TPA: SUF system NifU family Fe-S cluster assembly protein [Gammaproteobacteria bacterium]|jgi:nitrogen fixation NifU-like protein|nr:SUF system NifU family Fe-S cluster assembly protein [Gammaproteobacteria bacterium]HJP42975.1 SUF system NifU family Fe-S cluster assembly protein [Gammaproteobacteria bacterium]|tara:strand:+ start:427 stop:885 length:459 start_codon:yes stop_codon:yes gene_type:complete